VHMMWWESLELVVDITETMDLKLKALACHQSQFKDFAAVEKRVRDRNAELGKVKGYAYAECFETIVIER
jgi:LmbE family N-acetylglucosaminyl deacetylase